MSTYRELWVSGPKKSEKIWKWAGQKVRMRSAGARPGSCWSFWGTGTRTAGDWRSGFGSFGGSYEIVVVEWLEPAVIGREVICCAETAVTAFIIHPHSHSHSPLSQYPTMHHPPHSAHNSPHSDSTPTTTLTGPKWTFSAGSIIPARPFSRVHFPKGGLWGNCTRPRSSAGWFVWGSMVLGGCLWGGERPGRDGFRGCRCPVWMEIWRWIGWVLGYWKVVRNGWWKVKITLWDSEQPHQRRNLIISGLNIHHTPQINYSTRSAFELKIRQTLNQHLTQRPQLILLKKVLFLHPKMHLVVQCLLKWFTHDDKIFVFFSFLLLVKIL